MNRGLTRSVTRAVNRSVNRPISRLIFATPWGSIATDYDGTEYTLLDDAMTGVVDGKKGTCAFSFARNGNLGVTQIVVANTTNRIFMRFRSDNTLEMNLANAGATPIGLTRSSTAFTDTDWHTALISWDLSLGTAGLRMYIDGVDDHATGADVALDQNIDYTRDKWAVGASAAALISSPYFGCLSALSFYTDVYYDFDVKANRDLFYDSVNGVPVRPPGSPQIKASNGNPFVNPGSAQDFTDADNPGQCASAPNPSAVDYDVLGNSVSSQGTDNTSTSLDPDRRYTQESWSVYWMAGILESQFNKKLDLKKNRAVAGSTAQDAIDNGQLAQVIADKPSFCFVDFGQNGVQNSDADRDETKAALEVIYQSLRDAGIMPVPMTAWLNMSFIEAGNTTALARIDNVNANTVKAQPEVFVDFADGPVTDGSNYAGMIYGNPPDDDVVVPFFQPEDDGINSPPSFVHPASFGAHYGGNAAAAVVAGRCKNPSTLATEESTDPKITPTSARLFENPGLVGIGGNVDSSADPLSVVADGCELRGQSSPDSPGPLGTIVQHNSINFQRIETIVTSGTDDGAFFRIGVASETVIDIFSLMSAGGTYIAQLEAYFEQAAAGTQIPVIETKLFINTSAGVIVSRIGSIAITSSNRSAPIVNVGPVTLRTPPLTIPAGVTITDAEIQVKCVNNGVNALPFACEIGRPDVLPV